MTDTTKTQTAPKASKPRHIRTAQEIAQDALAEAEKKHAKAKANCDRLKKVAADAEQAFQDSIAEQATTEEELAWARRNPRLPKGLSIGTLTADVEGNVKTGGAS